MQESPIILKFKEFVEERTGIPIRLMRTIYYQGGDFGVSIDGVGDISVLKTDFLTKESNETYSKYN